MLKNYTYNRPLSPHFTIYLPQLTSLFSIWHRISGIFLFCFFICFITILEFIFNYNYLNLKNFSYWLFEFSYLFFIIIFSYHSLNGFRHIFWDCTLFLKITSLTSSSFILLLFFLLIFINTTALL